MKYFKLEPMQRGVNIIFILVLYFGWRNHPYSGTMRIYIGSFLSMYISRTADGRCHDTQKLLKYDSVKITSSKLAIPNFNEIKIPTQTCF